MCRRKRAYAKLDLEEQLECRGIMTSLLMPKLQPEEGAEPVQLNVDPNDPAPFPTYLPLEIFDNTEFDCREPSEWLALGKSATEDARKPVPGLALLPTRDDLGHRECTFAVKHKCIM